MAKQNVVRAGRPTKASQEERVKLLDLLNWGIVSQAQLAKSLRMSEGTVSNYLRGRGLREQTRRDISRQVESLYKLHFKDSKPEPEPEPDFKPELSSNGVAELSAQFDSIAKTMGMAIQAEIQTQVQAQLQAQLMKYAEVLKANVAEAIQATNEEFGIEEEEVTNS
jgi:transcriptional regulator with XRE-family HTH domain